MQGIFVMKVRSGCGSSPEPVLPLTVFPQHQNGRGDEDGGISSAQKADQEDGRKLLQGHATEQDQCQQQEFHGHQLCIDGALQGLYDRVVDQRFELQAAVGA